MEFEKIKNKGRARLFDSRLLEVMTITHPIVVYCMYFPVIFYLLYHGYTVLLMPLGTEVLFFIAGVFFWSFFEYVMHRYLFHLILDGEFGKRFVYVMHGVHHEYPRDKERLFMPPVPSILLAITLFFVFRLVLGAYAFSFFPGFVFGYLAYGSMHYAIHAFTPPRFLKALWRNHHLHHYKHPDKGFGVSSVLWDVVFGTVPHKDDA